MPPALEKFVSVWQALIALLLIVASTATAWGVASAQLHEVRRDNDLYYQQIRRLEDGLARTEERVIAIQRALDDLKEDIKGR